MHHLHYCLLALVLLSGCQYQPTTDIPEFPPEENISSHQEALYDITNWQLDGKIAYRYLGKNGSARINWGQRGDQFDMYLSAPFGGSATHIYGTSERAEMIQPDEATFSAASIPELSRRLLGFSLPFDDLLWWVRGLVAQDTDLINVQYFDNGLLARLDQSGWQLHFDRYIEQDGLQLPGRIKGWRHDTQFTLVIHRWQPK